MIILRPIQLKRLLRHNHVHIPQNVHIIVGLAVLGALVRQAEQKLESVTKFQIAMAELNRLKQLNPVFILQLVQQILGNAVIGAPARRREPNQEVATEHMIVRPRKQRHQRHRNIAKRQTNLNYNRQQKI